VGSMLFSLTKGRYSFVNEYCKTENKYFICVHLTFGKGEKQVDISPVFNHTSFRMHLSF